MSTLLNQISVVFSVKVVTRLRNYYDEEEEEWVPDKTTVGKLLTFKVYVFNRGDNEWKKVDSLGSMVFFLSRDLALSVCAEDLGWRNGNCICFEGLTGYDDEADMAFGLNGGFYSLENHVVSSFSSLSDDMARVFFPPDDCGNKLILNTPGKGFTCVRLRE